VLLIVEAAAAYSAFAAGVASILVRDVFSETAKSVLTRIVHAAFPPSAIMAEVTTERFLAVTATPPYASAPKLSLTAASTVALTASMTKESEFDGGRKIVKACVRREVTIREHGCTSSPASGVADTERDAFAK
jgi:hypothetical protein